MRYGCQLRLESFFESENQHDLFPLLMCKIFVFFCVCRGKKLMKYMHYGCQLRLESFFESENHHDLFPFLMCKILELWSIYHHLLIHQFNLIHTGGEWFSPPLCNFLWYLLILNSSWLFLKSSKICFKAHFESKGFSWVVLYGFFSLRLSSHNYGNIMCLNTFLLSPFQVPYLLVASTRWSPMIIQKNGLVWQNKPKLR